MLLQDLKSKLATLRWYAARPALYREVGRRIWQWNVSTARNKERSDAARAEGRRWCEANASAPERLFLELGLDGTLRSVAALFAAEWAQAVETVAACPVKMGGPANVDVLHHLTHHLKAQRVVETGVASGWSSLAILLAMRSVPQGRLVSIDMPYAKLNNEAYVGCAVPSVLRERWVLLRRSDRDGLPVALRDLGSIDLAHYDSDKSEEGRKYAYPKLWAALRSGGVLMSDDIEDNLAFRDFANSVGRKPWVLAKEKSGNFAGVLVK